MRLSASQLFGERIDNNLFLPLGWKTEVKSDVPFQLVGTVLKDVLGYYQAVLKSVDTQRVYFVTLNEVQDGWRLVMIAPKQVVLEKDDRRITLALNEQHLFIHSPMSKPHPLGWGDVDIADNST